MDAGPQCSTPTSTLSPLDGASTPLSPPSLPLDPPTVDAILYSDLGRIHRLPSIRVSSPPAAAISGGGASETSPVTPGRSGASQRRRSDNGAKDSSKEKAGRVRGRRAFTANDTTVHWETARAGTSPFTREYPHQPYPEEAEEPGEESLEVPAEQGSRRGGLKVHIQRQRSLPVGRASRFRANGLRSITEHGDGDVEKGREEGATDSKEGEAELYEGDRVHWKGRRLSRGPVAMLRMGGQHKGGRGKAGRKDETLERGKPSYDPGVLTKPYSSVAVDTPQDSPSGTPRKGSPRIDRIRNMLKLNGPDTSRRRSSINGLGDPEKMVSMEVFQGGAEGFDTPSKDAPGSSFRIRRRGFFRELWAQASEVAGDATEVLTGRLSFTWLTFWVLVCVHLAMTAQYRGTQQRTCLPGFRGSPYLSQNCKWGPHTVADALFQNEPFSVQFLQQWGARYGVAAMAGEWWRWVSPVLIHTRLLHLVIMAIPLVLVLSLLETRCDTGVAAFSSLLITFGSCLVGAVADSRCCTASGASGLVVGVVGMLLVELPRARAFALVGVPAWTPYVATLAAASLAVVVMGMLDALAGAQMFVSVWSHVGGLLSGFVVGSVRLTAKESTYLWRGVPVAPVAITAVAMSLVCGALTRFFTTPDAEQCGPHSCLKLPAGI